MYEYCRLFGSAPAWCNKNLEGRDKLRSHQRPQSARPADMSTDPADKELHFQADLIAANEDEAHRRRGPEQWVYLGANHPAVVWFPHRVEKCPAPEPDTLRRARLHELLEPLASVCARSTNPSLITMDQKFIPPSTLESRVRKATSYIPLREYSVELFRAVCEDKLAQHVDTFRVDDSDLADCDTAVVDPADPDTFIEPTIPSFKIMENSGGSGLLHAYGDMVGFIGSYFRREEQRGYTLDSASTRAEYVLDTMESASIKLGIAKPKGAMFQVARFQKMLIRSMWPTVLCAETDHKSNYAEEAHNRATIYSNQYKGKPGEDMLHLFAERFEHVLKKPEAQELVEFINATKKGPLNYNTVFMEARRLMPIATPKVLTQQKPDPNSVAGLGLLFKYIKHVRVVWMSNKFKKATSLTEAVTLLLEEAEITAVTVVDNEKPSTVSRGNASNITRSVGSSMEHTQLLNAEMNSQEYTWIDDRLTAHNMAHHYQIEEMLS